MITDIKPVDEDNLEAASQVGKGLVNNADSENNALIRFIDVSQKYTVQDGISTVLDNVSFSIERNSFTIIYGPSGSGKSTILNIIMGLLPPTSGKVTINGVNLYQSNQNQRALFRSKHFGAINQTNEWVKSLNVLENVAMPLFLKGEDYKNSLVMAKESLMRVGMEEYEHYSPTVLSIGQQQRVSLARATVEKPMVIVADEPTGSLDSKNGEAVLNMLTRYRSQFESTIVMVTHNMEYLSLSNNRIFIKDGAIMQYTGGYTAMSDEAKKIRKDFSI